MELQEVRSAGPRASVVNSIESQASAETTPLQTVVPPQTGAVPCPTCGANVGSHGSPSFVYAVGRIEPRFPRPSVEKEFAQATGRTGTANLTDPQVLEKVLKERHNRYLVRQLC